MTGGRSSAARSRRARRTDRTPSSTSSPSVARRGDRRWPGVASVGHRRARACTTRRPARRASSSTCPGDWDGVPVAAPIAAALGLPVALINDARAFGLAELRLGAGRGASSMVGLTLGTGVGGVIAIDGKVAHGPRRDGRRDRPPDDRPRRAVVQLRQPRLPRGVRPGGPDRRGMRDADRGGGRRAGTGRRRGGDRRARPRSAATSGSGSRNMIALVNPDRVVIGGGIAAAGDLLLDRARAEIRRRVQTTSLDEVEIVTAELGIWAGAIGAAVHGAELAAGRRRGRLRGATRPDDGRGRPRPAGPRRRGRRRRDPGRGRRDRRGRRRTRRAGLRPAHRARASSTSTSTAGAATRAMGDTRGARRDGPGAAPRGRHVASCRRPGPRRSRRWSSSPIASGRGCPARRPTAPSPLGFNLEGPFLAEAKKGAHDPAHLRAPADVDRGRRRAAARRPPADHDRAGDARRARPDPARHGARRRGCRWATRRRRWPRRGPATRPARRRRPTSSTR